MLGAVFGYGQASPFFSSWTRIWTRVEEKCRIYVAFSGLVMGSTPTVSINRGSVENSAFPRFLLYLCGFDGDKVCMILHSLCKVLHSKNGHVWTRIWTRHFIKPDSFSATNTPTSLSFIECR